MNSVYVFQEKPDPYRDEKDKKKKQISSLPPFYPLRSVNNGQNAWCGAFKGAVSRRRTSLLDIQT